MRASSGALNDRISFGSQISGNDSPSVVVYIRQRYWDNRNVWSGDGLIDPKQEWYQMTDKASTLDIQESVDSFSSSFTVTMANEQGLISPDNYAGKFTIDTEEKFTFAKQLLSDNQVRIFLGYGDTLIPYIHGYVGDVKISADQTTLELSCMTSYKRIIHQTIEEKTLRVPDGNLYNVLKFLFDKAGVTLHGEKVYVPGSDEEWIVKGLKGERGQSYDELIRDLVDTTFHYIKANADGSCTLMKIPTFKKDDPPDVIFDEGVNLTNLDYTITDQDVNCTVSVKCGNTTTRFTNTFLKNEVLLGRLNEEMIEVAWADTYLKRREVAIANHIQNLHKYRTLNAGIIADPRLELWDKVGIREHITGQTEVWHIKGIQTMFDAGSGFTMVLDLAVNYGNETMPPSDISPIQVSVDTIRLRIWDWYVEDGDICNIYCNDKLVAKNYKLLNKATDVDIKLELGNNVLVFEAVNAGFANRFTGRLEVLDTSNNVLFPVGSMPDLTFLRTNVDRNGNYRKRPSKTWVVARVE